MSNVHLVTFSTSIEDIGYPDLELCQLRLHRSARKVGIEVIESWDRTRLKKTEFYKHNYDLLREKRGAGYWAWKPFIILEALNKANMGDFVIYSDCTTVFHAHPKNLLELCATNNGFFLITQDSHGRNARYTKRDTFVLMNCDTAFYHNSTMTEAFFQIYQKKEQTLDFVNKYLDYCLNKAIVTDSTNVMGLANLDGFITHKHDMSVLSLLRLKRNIGGFRNPSQWGNHQKLDAFKVPGEYLSTDYSEPLDNSPYGTIIGWRENSEDLRRPLWHLFQPRKVGAYVIRKVISLRNKWRSTE